MTNIKREAENEAGGEFNSIDLLLKEAEQLLEVQNSLTDKKVEADYRMTNQVLE